jgi:plasmid stability protein
MQNRVVRIDRIHSRAISTEVAERLRAALATEQSEVPRSLQSQIDRLSELDEDSPSIVPSYRG